MIKAFVICNFLMIKCNQKEGRREMQTKHNNKQPSPLCLALTERAQCNHTARTQHNKRLFPISNRDLMTQLQSFSSELSQSLFLLTRLRLREIEWQNSIAYKSQKKTPTTQAFLLLPQNPLFRCIGPKSPLISLWFKS
jgi:hypothetical protein